jgi:hypothetical protein
MAGGDNREVTEEMSEKRCLRCGEAVMAAESKRGKITGEQQESEGGRNGCCGNAQWHVCSKEVG